LLIHLGESSSGFVEPTVLDKKLRLLHVLQRRAQFGIADSVWQLFTQKSAHSRLSLLEGTHCRSPLALFEAEPRFRGTIANGFNTAVRYG
jgi:hypothetical protein